MKTIRGSLLFKLILAFLFVTLVTTGMVSVFIRFTSTDRLVRLVVGQQRTRLQATLEDYYAQNGGWGQIRVDWMRFGSLTDSVEDRPTRGDKGRQVESALARERLFGLADEEGRVLIPVDTRMPEGTQLSGAQIAAGTPVTVAGKRVGTILTASWRPVLTAEETLFLRRTNEALLFAGAGALVISLVIGVLLARSLIHPLQELTSAAQAITRGKLEQQVQVTTSDEVGRLAEAFNQMSLEVSRSNQVRRRMTADIAHDLRTPLTVISGYVESMRDGVLQPTPERLALIYAEIERLQHLVGDLKLLSLADSGELPLHPQRMDPRALLEQAAAPFGPRAAQQEVMLSVDAAPGLPEIAVDAGRMMQVFNNLVSNSLRYTGRGGSITLGARSAPGGGVTMAVTDTGSGISAEDLPFIFERFHRVDPSRHAEEGEAGLGLAIVKALVEANKGTVRAQSSPGKGTTIFIDLPAAGEGSTAVSDPARPPARTF